MLARVRSIDPELVKARVRAILKWGIVASLLAIGADMVTTFLALYILTGYEETNPYYPALAWLGPAWLAVNFVGFFVLLVASAWALRRWWGPVSVGLCVAAIVMVLPAELWAVLSNISVLTGHGALPHWP